MQAECCIECGKPLTKKNTAYLYGQQVCRECFNENVDHIMDEQKKKRKKKKTRISNESN